MGEGLHTNNGAEHLASSFLPLRHVLPSSPHPLRRSLALANMLLAVEPRATRANSTCKFQPRSRLTCATQTILKESSCFNFFC